MLDTVRVCAPDGAQREVDGITGRRYRSTDGVYDMHPADAAAYRKIGAFLPNLVGASTRKGFRCGACGFGSWFAVCGRCGGACGKETDNAPSS